LSGCHGDHSILDSCGLAIQTKAGTVIHTADFKIDHTPIDGLTTDLHRFAHYGSKGVLCLLSDSTNSHKSGFTKSEAVVGRTFDNLFSIAKGRVIMSTFSSIPIDSFQLCNGAGQLWGEEDRPNLIGTASYGTREIIWTIQPQKPLTVFGGTIGWIKPLLIWRPSMEDIEISR